MITINSFQKLSKYVDGLHNKTSATLRVENQSNLLTQKGYKILNVDGVDCNKVKKNDLISNILNQNSIEFKFVTNQKIEND